MFNYMRQYQAEETIPNTLGIPPMDLNTLPILPVPPPIDSNTLPRLPVPAPIKPDMSRQETMSDMAKCYDDMEIIYLKKVYPPICQRIQPYIDDELSQYDHDLSPIYEMYPSKETIDYMVNGIYTRMKGDLPNVIKGYEYNRDTQTPIGGSFYTLVYALLLNELYRKRIRRQLSPAHSLFYNYQ